jgi:ribA/ribD-fused uncharacterized protein
MNTSKFTSRAELILAIQAGFQPKFLFFWGHTPAHPDITDKSCFSQWWEAVFELEGVRYTSAEHYMMAAKARLFGDTASLERILACKSPAEAKKWGRLVKGFDEQVWQNQRLEWVIQGNLAKFSQNPLLERFLLETGTRVLVEAAPRDLIWGIGLGQNDPRAQDPATWQGLNLLGFALMEVRRHSSGV